MATLFETTPHAYIELSMSALGIEWKIKTIDVNDVDIKDNLHQTRVNIKDCDSSVSREYADKIKSGDAFPMIVLQEKSPCRYRVVCGRHRATAYGMAQNGKTSYAAYVVAGDTDPVLLKSLSARENNANGVRQNNSDTARAAADQLSRTPIAGGGRKHRHEFIKSVAACFGMDPSTVSNHYHSKLIDSEMIRANCEPGGVPVHVAARLWKWTESADWFGIARAISTHWQSVPLQKIIAEAHRDKIDGKALIKRIEDAVGDAKSVIRGAVAAKDPVTVTIEHLSLALQDIRVLAPPRNLSDEQAEEVSDLVEAVRLSCKEWKSR